MKKYVIPSVMLAVLLVFSFAFVSCDNGTTSENDDSLVDDIQLVPTPGDLLGEDSQFDPTQFDIFETDMYFLAVDKGIAVTNKHIRYISNELIAIERETNLKFSSMNYPKLNIVASDKLSGPGAAYVSTNGTIFLLSTSYLNVVATYPFIIYHEGLHSIRWRNDYLGSNTAFEEGLAQFVAKTLLLSEGFIGNNHPDAVPVLNTYYLPQIMNISTQIERIFSTGGNVDHSLAESAGEVFF